MEVRVYLSLCVALLFAAPVAADIDYNYVEAGYGLTSADVADPLDGDATGPEIRGSYEVYGPVYVLAGFDYKDFSSDNVEFSDITLGVGVHQSLTPDTSTFLNLTYLRNEIDPAGLRSFNEEGFGVTLGYRAENQTPWEFVATVDYVNVESGVDTGAAISLLYDVSLKFSVIGSVSYSKQDTGAFLGVRYNLGWLQ